MDEVSPQNETRLCSLCGPRLGLKPLSAFSRHKRGRGGFDSRCRDCKSSVFAAWRSAPAKKRLHTLTGRRYRESIKRFIDGLKSEPCKDCGTKYPPPLMEFDHLTEKILSVSMLQKQKWCEKKILSEVAKCDLVCIGCHRLRTEARFSPPKEPESLRERRRQERVAAARKCVLSAKDHPCSRCNGRFVACQMDFDHRPGTRKECAVSTLVGRGISVRKLLEEIVKCDLLCAWCHRLITIERELHEEAA
jgi:hypothetical protein